MPLGDLIKRIKAGTISENYESDRKDNTDALAAVSAVVPWVEVAIGAAILALNLCCIWVLASAKQKAEPFSRTLVSINLLINISHVFHPLSWIAFADRQPLERGAYAEAVLHNLVHFVSGVGVTFEHLKMFILAIERFLALKLGPTRLGQWTTRIVGGAVLLVVLQIAIKTLFFLILDSTDLDCKLRKGLTAESSPAVYMASHTLYYVSVLFGIAVYLVLCKVHQWYQKPSQNRQRIRIRNIRLTLRPVLAGEMAGALFTVPVFVVSIMLVRGRHDELWLSIYDTSSKTTFLVASLLALYSTLLAIRRIGLKQEFLQDPVATVELQDPNGKH